MRGLSCFAVVLSVMSLPSALAQTGIDGAILGVVTDPNGGMIAGATVTVINLNTGIQKVETSRNDGSFEISALPKVITRCP